MDRKEKIRQYKETPLPAGVFRVRNNVSMKSFVGSSPNLPGMLNRQRFQLEHGSHPDRELQKDWKELGPDAFSFETLDQLEPSNETDHDPSEELQVLLQMWVDKLKETGELLYGKRIMFEALEKINERPEPFQFYTANDLWDDEHTSKQMLSFHLDEAIDVSSRNAEFINRSVKWIAEKFNIDGDTHIADFGCGPGLYTARLAKRGANVTGIDFSKRSIAYAKEVAAREQLNISYVNQNYLEFETEDRFDLVLMIMCDFCALSPIQRKIMLSKFHNIIKARGSVLLDVYSLRAFEQRKRSRHMR